MSGTEARLGSTQLGKSATHAGWPCTRSRQRGDEKASSLASSVIRGPAGHSVSTCALINGVCGSLLVKFPGVCALLPYSAGNCGGYTSTHRILLSSS